MSEPREYRWWTGAVRPALAIGACATVVIGGLLYEVFTRHDRAAAQELGAAAARAAEQRALAAAEMFAASARPVMVTDMSRLQDLVTALNRTDGWLDAMVVSRDAVVLAAKQPEQVGQSIPESLWASWKRGGQLVARRAVDHTGRPVYVVVMPVKEGDDLLASVMLVADLPADGVVTRTPLDRVEEIGFLMVPVFLFLLAVIGLSMKVATGALRRQIRALVTEVLGAQPDSERWAPKAG
jgi:hypothetical protein